MIDRLKIALWDALIDLSKATLMKTRIIDSKHNHKANQI